MPTALAMLTAAGMTNPLEEQRAWLRAILEHTGLTAHSLALKAGLSHTTLRRPLNEPGWKLALSAKTIAAVADAVGLRPMQYPGRSQGFSAPEATRYVFDTAADAIGGNMDRAVRELTRGRNGRDPWEIKGYGLELAGILPDDIVIVDLNMQARAKDIVCVQLYQWAANRAETVFRLYDPPFIVTHSLRLPNEKPQLVDNDSVVIKGVVDGLLRRRAAEAA